MCTVLIPAVDFLYQYQSNEKYLKNFIPNIHGGRFLKKILKLFFKKFINSIRIILKYHAFDWLSWLISDCTKPTVLVDF
jgi:hypothetical protein